jgi:hypothetical protein
MFHYEEMLSILHKTVDDLWQDRVAQAQERLRPKLEAFFQTGVLIKKRSLEHNGASQPLINGQIDLTRSPLPIIWTMR